MNTATITGVIATAPRYRIRGFTPTTTFDVTVPFARRSYTFHVRALNALAKTSRRWHVGDQISVTGYLHAEPFDMPDRSVWHRVDIVAYEIDHRLQSRYPVPDELTDPTVDDDAIWIITDDVGDPDAVTTILWPSDS